MRSPLPRGKNMWVNFLQKEDRKGSPMYTQRLETCNTCGGEGYLVREVPSEEGDEDEYAYDSELRTCPTCGGAGSILIKES